MLGGYVDNLRAARAADGGAVLVLDAGDTFQGGIESNLSEGAMVVDAYNAIGYAALAIGNHDFDFGPVDPRGPARQWLPLHVARRGVRRHARRVEGGRRARTLSVSRREHRRRGDGQAGASGRTLRRRRSSKPPASASASSAR